MFKQLRNYYIIVSLPFVLLLTGALYFHKAIESTISRNPHPQINFAIFYIILFGGVLILLSIYKLVKEAKTIKEYSEAVKANETPEFLQNLANSFTGDISYLLQMVAASTGRSISHQEQAAIEHELTNARTKLFRRNSLPQYLTGLLVGMGLLGTFVGLLSTLSDISILINSFSELDMTTANPLVIFRTMIERMRAPMQSMSIAFSASMFGLLGSIILGLMMLGIRRIQGDIVSLMTSEVARHIEIALSHESSATKKQAVVQQQVGNSVESHVFDSAILLRIEERLAESLRVQQRILNAEKDAFEKEKIELIQSIKEQNNSNVEIRGELKQLNSQLNLLVSAIERKSLEKDDANFEALSQLSSAIKENSKIQLNAIHAVIDELQKQRNDIQASLASNSTISNNLYAEIIQLQNGINSLSSNILNNKNELSDNISELIVHTKADSKESNALLKLQIEEQKKLREILDWRTKTE